MCPACNTGDPLCRSSSGMDESELSWLASLQIAGRFSSDTALPPNQQQEADACQSPFQSFTVASRPPKAPIVRMPSTLLSDLAAEMLSSPTPTNPEPLTGLPFLRRPDAPVPSAECASELPSLPVLLESGPPSSFGHHNMIAAELNDVEGDTDGIIPPAVASSFSNGESLSPNSFSDFAILPQPRSALTCRRSDAGILASGRLMTETSAAAPEPHSGIQRRASESSAGSYRINPSTAFDTSLSFSFSSSPPVFPPWDTNTIPVAPAASAATTWKSPMKRKSQIQGDACFVQSCRADLRDSKPYNRRYNMCPDCMKAGSVVVDDNEMRWCQQCSCLHPLSEFLGKRRSCKEKMDKHKDRRRARNKERREKAKKGRAETAQN